jgi:hypothetical protein
MKWDGVGSYNFSWSQRLFVINVLQMPIMVSDMTPQIEGHGEPPNVNQRADNRMSLLTVRHSEAVEMLKWHQRYAASKSNLLVKIFVGGCLNLKSAM